MRNPVLTAALMFWVAACASASDPTPGGPDRDRNRISPEEIAAEPVMSAAELVERLRPAWLRSRGPESIRSGAPSLPIVYIDGVRSGGPEALRGIITQIIREIRFINGRDATTKYGLDHGAGVILVSTGR